MGSGAEEKNNPLFGDLSPWLGWKPRILAEKFDIYDAEELLKNSSKSPLVLPDMDKEFAAAATAAFCCESARCLASAACIFKCKCFC